MDKELQKKITEANHAALFQAIKKTKLPLREVAEILGISRQHLDNIKRQVTDIRASSYIYFCHKLNVNLTEQQEQIKQIIEEHHARITSN